MIFKLSFVFVCTLTFVRAQFENGIIFSGGAVAPTNPVPTPYIANQGKCVCVLAGTCPAPPNPNIDIRIVNMGKPNPTPCPAGYVVCCTNTTPAPVVDGTCGVRKITPTPQPAVGQAAFGAYPWQAALLNRGEAFLGSGVLLDASHVLTAAHKVAAFANNPGALLVRVGEWNGRTQSEPYQALTVNVARVTLHPSYNSVNLENDLAIVKLNGVVPVASYPNVNTACKPVNPPITGQRCYVSGWGKDLFGPTGNYQSIMREVDVPILDSTDCENRLKQTRLGAAFVLNRNSFLCAGGEAGKDACTGDGGSPLVCQRQSGQWQVVGIVAWGIGCANQGVPGVYTNVYNYLTWINQVVAIP